MRKFLTVSVMGLVAVLLASCVPASPQPLPTTAPTPVPTPVPTPIMQTDLDDFARMFARSDGDVLPPQDYADQILDLVDCVAEIPDPEDPARLAGRSAGEIAASNWFAVVWLMASDSDTEGPPFFGALKGALSGCFQNVAMTLMKPPSRPESVPSWSFTLEDSEYPNVFVYTYKETEENEGRSQLSLSYPVTMQGGTMHEAINARMKEISHQFVDEYRTVAAEIEKGYQKEKGASFKTSYQQTFDTGIAGESLISFTVEHALDTGGTGNVFVAGYIFDRNTGAELTISDLFVDDSYLEVFSDLTRVALEARVKDEKLGSDPDWIEGGTEPTAENFDNILFQGDGTILITFDKYQVASGVDGIVAVELPVFTFAELLKPEIRQILDVQ